MGKTTCVVLEMLPPWEIYCKMWFLDQIYKPFLHLHVCYSVSAVSQEIKQVNGQIYGVFHSIFDISLTYFAAGLNKVKYADKSTGNLFQSCLRRLSSSI